MRNNRHILEYAHLKHFWGLRSYVLPAVVMCLVAGLALYFLQSSRASGAVIVAEPEAGSVTVPAQVVSDTAASGAKAVQFQPSAPVTTVKVMPLGDSITTGVGGSGGYRVRLWQRLVQTDQDKIDFVGSNSLGPTTLGDKDHEGHPGFCMELPCEKGSMSDNIISWMTLNSPDIILLHGGTNDITFTFGDATQTTSHLDKLLGLIYTKKPTVTVIVAKIIQRYDSSSLNTATTTYNTNIATVVQKYQGQGRKIQIVNMSNVLTQADYADGKHPNQAGYDKMADVWYPAVSTAYRTIVGP